MTSGNFRVGLHPELLSIKPNFINSDLALLMTFLSRTFGLEFEKIFERRFSGIKGTPKLLIGNSLSSETDFMGKLEDDDNGWCW